MRPGLSEEFDLVLVGMPGWLDRETRARVRSGLDGVRALGYVAERDMPAIMAGATVFAYPRCMKDSDSRWLRQWLPACLS